MDAIELQVKTFIESLSTGGDPAFLKDDTGLADLGFDDNGCIALTNKLNGYLRSINAGASVSRDDISPEITAGDVVVLVRKALV